MCYVLKNPGNRYMAPRKLCQKNLMFFSSEQSEWSLLLRRKRRQAHTPSSLVIIIEIRLAACAQMAKQNLFFAVVSRCFVCGYFRFSQRPTLFFLFFLSCFVNIMYNSQAWPYTFDFPLIQLFLALSSPFI